MTAGRPQAGVPALLIACVLLLPAAVVAKTVEGTPRADRINGTAGKDRLAGGKGNDRISGRGAP